MVRVLCGSIGIARLTP
ncbi:hypothetical protein P3386_24315 [Vibrio parahaemolyticus]|nr:hypothetical protein [Vibrio parahaemolyticus]